MLLDIRDLRVSYGPVRALEGISLHVEKGEVVALLGANGAGKTTTLRAVSGLVPVESGTIRFDGQDVLAMRAEEIVRAGLAHAPEGRRIFGEQTVLENLELGAYLVRDHARLRAGLQRAFHYFPVLEQRSRQRASTLSGGEQQMLAVARALMSAPRLLMLDEPSLGLAPMLVDQIFEIIRQINREEGVAVFLVEQNANEALLHADRAYILENGAVALDGPAETLRQNPRVVEAYLGG
jgi:branched-chain amino acid transport system ATP-binding protein